ncbi:NACHT domain-containing protein [Sarocladium implicatum]|nr:NACHT domain-containing protein [Sarocladium implicatum]
MATISLDEEFQQLAEDFQKKAKLTPQQLKAFKLTKVEDIRTVLADVQKKHQKDRACIWLRRLDPFINTFLEFGNIIEVFLNTSDFLAFIWGPLKWLLWITRNYSKALSSLLDLYRDLSKQMNFLQAIKSQMNDSNNIRQVLVWIYKDILEFHVKAMEFFAKGRWGQLFESNWRGFTDSVSQIKDSLSLNSRLIDSHVTVTVLEEIRLLRQKFAQESENRLAERALKRRTAVLNWLNPSFREVSYAHESHLEARSNNPGSCEWIMEQNAFQQWYDLVYCRTPLLWISGKPGAGKSVVASYIVEQLQKYPDASTAYFYFSHRKPLQDNFRSMATTLVAQLMQHDALLDYLYTTMSNGHAGNVSTKAEAGRLLDFSLRVRKTFVVLDGLDECDRDERLHICEWFRSTVEKLDRKQHGDIRCLFICQEDGIANKDLRDIAHLRITSELNRKDILSFSRIAQNNIEAQLGSCPLGPEQASISDVVTHRANGMFIYAKLVLDELKSYPTKGLITEHWSPEDFPDQISDVYDRILQRLNSQAYGAQVQFRNRILTFICVARRPLRWFELQAAISLNPERNVINRDEDRTPRTCEEICASFVQVQKDETVVLVHSTARE